MGHKEQPEQQEGACKRLVKVGYLDMTILLKVIAKLSLDSLQLVTKNLKVLYKQDRYT